jgi:hypothetical protein
MLTSLGLFDDGQGPGVEDLGLSKVPAQMAESSQFPRTRSDRWMIWADGTLGFLQCFLGNSSRPTIVLFLETLLQFPVQGIPCLTGSLGAKSRRIKQGRTQSEDDQKMSFHMVICQKVACDGPPWTRVQRFFPRGKSRRFSMRGMVGCWAPSVSFGTCRETNDASSMMET